MTRTQKTTQEGITAWFDRTYASRGFRYLRPYAAYPIFVQMLGLPVGARVLDVACGPGHLLRAAGARGLDAVGVDLSLEGLRLARAYVPEAPVARANAERLPFRDGAFDGVTCIGSLERFLDRDAALAELSRVTTAGARLCLMVRNARTPSWKLWRELLGRRNAAGHQDALDLAGWRSLFDRRGLQVLSTHPDQWGRQRLRWWVRGRREPDPAVDEPVARTLLPLRWANEFVFVLGKTGGSV